MDTNNRFIYRCSNVMVTIFTGDTDVTAQHILQNAQNTFNITVDAKRIQFVFLYRRRWVEAKRYPHFTLLLQSLGSVVLAIEALIRSQPGIEEQIQPFIADLNII